VLACAFSNVGADNLAEQMLKLGLNVVRIGKPSAVSKHLWEHTLEHAIDQDPTAQRALANAASATAQLSKSKLAANPGKRSSSVGPAKGAPSAQVVRVRASIQAANVAATKALRRADVVVCTSTGAADPRLLAACGIVTDQDAKEVIRGPNVSKKPISAAASGDRTNMVRAMAPDKRPPISMPFVMIDEACQSVEPASLIPLTASNSCRSLVLLGDPCQLPPTVRSSPTSPLSVSLMERLASTLQHPVMVTAQNDQTTKDQSFLESKPTKQALSLIRAMSDDQGVHTPYRKRFSGSLLLSVQYRMHPSISSFASAVFYDGLLSTPQFLGHQRPFPESLRSAYPHDNASLGVRFVHVGGRNNERRGRMNRFTRTVYGPGQSLEQQSTFSNQEEAWRVVELVKDILEHDQERGERTSIGVVTPYNGQVEMIKALLAEDEEYQELVAESDFPVEVKSVDGYQGRERDVIIFSAVRSNRGGNIGFLQDWRRMNVALTRAKTGLVVFGDIDTLQEGDKHWAAFAKWCKGHLCVVGGS